MGKPVLFLIITAVALVVDLLWITKISSGMYLEGMGPIARLNSEGRMAPVLWSAVIVYLIIPLAVTVFICNDLATTSWAVVIAKGAFLGFCMYGVYDFTNYATLKDWPLKMALIDVAWGTFLCALLSAVGKFADSFTSAA
jgi:uncharacterized membrane protein